VTPALLLAWLVAAPSVDADACPEIDAAALASALEIELAAEPDAIASEDPVVVDCTGDAVIVRVGSRYRTIEGPDRIGLTERSLALAIAPLFVELPAAAEPTSPEPVVAEAPPPPPVVAPQPIEIAKPPPREPPPRIAALVRPFAFIHDAGGVGGQLGVIGWPARRIGLSLVGVARWGRARRERGHVDALVLGAGPGLAVRLGSRRVKFRADLIAAIAYARLEGKTDRATTRSQHASAMALDLALDIGVQLDLRHVALVPALVIGTTPGAPIGVVTDERDVSLLRPWFGLMFSVEPWLRRISRR
jgi:hypothetical protein